MKRRLGRRDVAETIARATRMIEALEPRRLLTAFTVDGTAAADVIVMDYHIAINGIVVYDFTVNGVNQQSIGSSFGNTISINGFDGNDEIDVKRAHFADVV